MTFTVLVMIAHSTIKLAAQILSKLGEGIGSRGGYAWYTPQYTPPEGTFHERFMSLEGTPLEGAPSGKVYTPQC